MDIIEQVSSIQYLVNNSSSKENAMNQYAGMEGITLSKKDADKAFNEAIEKKFKEKKTSKIKGIKTMQSEKIIESILKKSDKKIRPAGNNMLDIDGISGPMRVVLDKDKIEFYDLRYPHTPDGQFISSYYVETLLEGKSKNRGLDLHGGVDSWKVPANSMKKVFEFIEKKTK